VTCEEFSQLVHEYTCGELDAVAAADLEAHARGCGACARELDHVVALDAALRGVAAVETVDSRALDRRVREQIAAESAAGDGSPFEARLKPRRRRLIEVVGIAAAVALMVFTYQELSPPRSGGMLKAAAEDHKREVVDGQWRLWLRDPTAINTLMEQIGVTSQSLTSVAPAGYHLDRAKRCPLGGVSFVHLVFTNGTQEFSVYLGAAVPRAKLAKEGANQAGIYAADFDANHVDCFETPRLTAMVVANSSPHSTLTLAKLLRSSL
jgi:hypothetical protein